MPSLPNALAPWIYRACWLLLPVVAGPAIGDAFADASRPVQLVSALLAWATWGVCLTASLVPRSTTLTAIRLITPGAVALSGWAAVGADRPGWAAAGLALAVVASIAVLSPSVADVFVDGSSYGDERRVSLRVPLTIALVPVPLAWAVLAAASVTGPLLLAARQWVLGALVTAVGAAVVAKLVERFHLLSRRWLVFVPAGVVVHDALQLTEPILVHKKMLSRLGPAPADTDALDITGGALGLALELRSIEPIEIGIRKGRSEVEHTDITALLVTPGRPATTLEVAESRRLPVG